MTTTTWHETKARLTPRYSVNNQRYETTYTIPLGSGDGDRSLELSFRLAPGAAVQMPADYRDIDVEFSLRLAGAYEEPAPEVSLRKDDMVTLQKLLVRVLEHSRIRRFEWLAERHAEA